MLLTIAVVLPVFTILVFAVKEEEKHMIAKRR